MEPITWDELLAQTKSAARPTVTEANDQLLSLRDFNRLQAPKKKRGNPEMVIVNDILAYLAKRGDIHAWRMNAGKVKTDKGHWFQGAPDGTADIIGIHLGSGRMVAIEVKAGNNQPTEAQMNFLDMVTTAGGVAFPAWSVEHVEQQLGVMLDDWRRVSSGR